MAEAVTDPNTVWFGNLPNDTDEAGIRSFAAKSGAISKVEVGRQGRVAWVTYSSPAEATRALSLEGQDFGGRPLKAELSNRGEKKPREARERKPRAAKEGAAGGAGGADAGAPAASYDNRIVVLRLARDADPEAVKAAFEPFGTITSVKSSRFFVRVTYESAESATKALAKNDTELLGRTIRVEKEIKKAKKPAKAKAAAAPAPAAAKKESAAPKTRGPRRVLVTGIPASATPEAVKAALTGAGPIASVTIEDGAATVTFETAEGAAAAVAGYNGKSIAGGAATVAIAPSRPRGDRGEAGAGKKRTSAEEGEEVPAGLVWVGNLPAGITEERVRALFAGAGAITSVSVRAPSPERTFAYVQYAAEAAVPKAVALNGHVEAGNAIKVEKATRMPRAPKSPKA